MNTQLILITSTIFAQAYGAESYGAQQYSASEGQTEVPAPSSPAQPTPVPQATVEGAPNTGLFGLPAGTDYSLVGGVALVVVALIGIIAVITSRVRRGNK